MDEGDGKDQMDQLHQNKAISAVADDGFMAEEDDDDYEDLYNDVNVGEGFLQSMRKNEETGSRNEDKEKDIIEGEDKVEPVLGTSEAEVLIPGLVAESVAEEGDAQGGEGEASGNDVVVASSEYGAQEGKVSDVSQKIPGEISVGIELGQGPIRVSDVEAPRGNNISQVFLPPPPPLNVVGNNENLMRPVMGNVNSSSMVGNGATIVTGGGTGGSGGGTFLLVGDFHWWTTDAEIEAELCKYGSVKEIKFFDEKASGKSKGYCQVEFYDPMAATACKDGMNGYAFSGRPCVVEYASPYLVKRIGEAQVNKTQQARTNNNNAIGGNFQGGENRGFGRGNWGRGMGGRGPGGPVRNRPGGMGGRGLMGTCGGGFGQGMSTGPPMNMMHQPMMGQGFEQAFGGPMARMGGYGGFQGLPGSAFPGILSSFPPGGGVGLPGVAPHVNPAFFGRGMPINGMGMMPNAGVDGGHTMGMWDPNSGVLGGSEDLGNGRAAEPSYGEEDASDHQYGEVMARPNPVKEKERASEREWSGSLDRRNREDKDASYERDIAREKDVGHGYDMTERRYRDDRDTGREREREHHHKDRERSRDRERDHDGEMDRKRDRPREERERYGGDHRSRHREEPERDDEWNRGRSSRGHSKSRFSREDNKRSRSRDVDYGKRRRK